MMNRSLYFAVFALAFCVYICFFYRTSTTNLNVLVNLFFDNDLIELKTQLRSILPLNNILIYNAPEALWIFSLTIFSKDLSISLYNHRIKLLFIPPIYIIVAEYFQYFHITDGTFDQIDIWLAVLFWIIGFTCSKMEKGNYLNQVKKVPRFAIFVFLLFSVYLADINILS